MVKMVVCLISLNVLTVKGKEVARTEDFAQLTGIQETQNIVLRWKIDSCT
jgi:hypothetical protein